MYRGGIERAETMMAKAESKGNSHQNPYAKSVFKEYVLPIAEALRAEIAGQAGMRPPLAHVKLLRDLDPETVSFLAVRTAMNSLLMSSENNHRSLGKALGAVIHNELILIQIEDQFPELYHTLARDLGRRLSKSERHRMTVMKMQAIKAGFVDFADWDIGSRDQVGLYLLGLMEDAGFVEIAPIAATQSIRYGGPLKEPYRDVLLSEYVVDEINKQKAYTAISMPVYGPTVVPPRDWTSVSDGGFYTKEMIRGNRYLVHATASARARYRDHQMPIVLDAVNALQRTAWKVNTELLDVVIKTAAEGRGTKEIVSLNDIPRPDKPEWLTKDIDKESMTEQQAMEFKAWKRNVAEWHTQRKIVGTRYGRFYSATRSAEMFREYPEIFFVYFADSRGRLYPMTYGLNPQGSDLQRSLLKFAQGMPVDTPEAIRWFHVQGANKWGFDKATLEERQQWVVERQDLILSMARDPLANDEWKKADKPLQFLAWALEYRDWVEDRDGSFLSYLPISMDGSCNGLQNLSALLRDEIGGEATNLTSSPTMQDIYKKVADAAVIRLMSMEEDALGLRSLWLSHGVSRKVVKRSVMTTPYGVTKSSAEDYIISDYLQEVENPFQPMQYRAAAKVLLQALWPAIGDVVVKGRLAMTWLKKSAHSIIKATSVDEEPVIEWLSPSGFLATQAYFKTKDHRITTRLHGPVTIRVAAETDSPDKYRHASGLAPNFVHSMDAAHLHRTTQKCTMQGVKHLAMIHDDYGTHAANAQILYETIREQFVQMYLEHDPIQEFKDKYPMVPKPPTPGTLDITEVLKSKFFFS